MRINIKIISVLFLITTLFSVESDSLSTIKKNPEFAKKISFIPGAGQFYNEDYLKGAMVITSEIYTLTMANKYSSNIVKRNNFIWWSLGIYIFSLIDAYVDAELSTFPDENTIKQEE